MKDRNKGNRFKNLWFVYTRGGQTAARCSSKLRLSELSENLYICFLSFISIVKCRNIAKWYCGSYSVPYSITFASRYKKNYYVIEAYIANKFVFFNFYDAAC